MRRILAALTLLPLLAAFAPARDDEEPPPPTNKIGKLTKEEIQAGWISLFDGESTFGWHIPDGSKWNVVSGMLAPEGTKPAMLVNDTYFGDYELSIEYRVRDTALAHVLVDCNRNGVSQHGLTEAEKKGGPSTIPLQNLGNSWVHLSCQVIDGKAINVQQTTFNANFATKTAVSGSGAAEQPKRQPNYLALSGSGLVIRSIKIRPLLKEQLFNGKDLTGWKEFPGKKSKFSVGKERTLDLKNGPGDLQTEGQWADFVLQAECKTNGKNLNSGIFFRCRPGEYQQGYEAQIHNGFSAKPKTYNVEVYDPKTHELKEKKKVEARATDYGTGAIYNRVPARVQAARDGEWFTMTIVAEGNHLATWVNGVQTVDWDDNRPLADNARKGCRLEKGPISLQGHDATTDLNFRNIRLGELGGKEKKEPEAKEK